MWVSTCGFKSHLPHKRPSLTDLVFFNIYRNMIKKGHEKGVPIILQLILLITLLVQSFFVSPFLHLLLSFNYVFGGPSSLSIIFVFSVFFSFSSVLTVIISPNFNLSIHFIIFFNNFLTFIFCTPKFLSKRSIPQ